MAFESTTPNMGLIEPGVGLTAGPQYASDLNASLTIIDAHNHAPGSGVQITPAGIDINTDLAFNVNGLTTVKSLQFTPQSSPLSILGSIYESGVDLYYNDGNGNQIQITSGGSVNAGSGSITGLVSPASASYIAGSQTFVWQSGVNTAANMDAGSLIIRKLTAASSGITLSAPSSLPSDYTITLPSAVPAATSILQMSATGVISNNLTVDGTTVQIISNQLVASTTPAPGSITGSMIASQTITESNLELRPSGTSVSAGGIGKSTSSGNFSSSSMTLVDVTNLSTTIVTTGRPVLLIVQSSDGTSPSGPVSYFSLTGTNPQCNITFNRDGSTICEADYQTIALLPFNMTYLDTNASAGSHTYKVQIVCGASSSIHIFNKTLIAYEI